MAESESRERLAPPQVVMANEQYLQQKLAEEVAERAKDPLSEAKRPGGFFIQLRGDDAVAVDAEGREIKDEDLNGEEKKAVQAQRKGIKEQVDSAAEAEKERAKLAAEADKVQRRADEANRKATEAAIEAGRARGAAEVGPRRGGRK